MNFTSSGIIIQARRCLVRVNKINSFGGGSPMVVNMKLTDPGSLGAT